MIEEVFFMLHIVSIALMCFSLTLQGIIFSVEESYHGVTLTATRARVDGAWYMLIQGEGLHTFEITRGDENIQYYPENIWVYEDHFYLTGYVIEITQETRHIHPFMIMISSSGDIDFETIMVDDDFTSIINFIPLEQGFFIHYRHHILNDTDDFEFKRDVVEYWENHIANQTYNFEERILRIEAQDGFVLLSTAYHGVYELMIDQDFNLLLEPTLYGVVDQGIYYDSVTLYFNGPLYYEGILYNTPITWNHPGTYTFVHNQQTYVVTVHPTLHGVYDNMVTNKPVSIDYEVGMPFLNNQPYAPNELIDRPGHYTLIFENKDYRYAIAFTITSQLQGVFDRQVYHDARQLTFQGEGYLNNQFIESGVVIHESGQYTLQIFGDNGYHEKHHFTIALEPEDQTVELLMIVEIGLLISAVSLGAILLYKTIKRR